MDESVGVRKGEHLCSELKSLLCSILGHISGAGYDYRLSFEAVSPGGEHGGSKIACAVACGLRSERTASPVEPLAGEDSGELVAEPLVLAEHESYLPASYADVACRHISVLSDMPLEFRHEALAEPHHFIVRFSFRIEV